MLLSRQSLVLCALIALSASLVGLSRLTLPRRLALAESLPAALQGFTHQAAGYVRIPADGAYALTVFFAGNARLFVDGVPAGCGGILFVDPTDDEAYGEVKRMYVRSEHRGQGLGRRILEGLVAHARDRGVLLLRLETGIDQREAIGLYEAMGFRERPPFGPYREDPLSPCYELRLS